MGVFVCGCVRGCVCVCVCVFLCLCLWSAGDADLITTPMLFDAAGSTL